MKTWTAIFVMVLISTVAHSQVLIALVLGKKLQSEKLEFGLTVNPTRCDISNVGGNDRSGLGLGLYFNVKLSNNLFFHPEGLPKAAFGTEGLAPYSLGNANLDSTFANTTVRRKVKSMSLPLLLRYRVWKLFFVEAGPQVNLMLTVKDEFKSKSEEDEITYSKKITEQFARLDLGLAFGLVYKLKKDKGMGLGVRYYYGMTDTMKSMVGSQINQAWYVTIAIPIGVEDKPAEGK